MNEPKKKNRPVVYDTPVVVRITADTKRKLDLHAADMEVPVSTVFRWALTEYIEKHKL